MAQETKDTDISRPIAVMSPSQFPRSKRKDERLLLVPSRTNPSTKRGFIPSSANQGMHSIDSQGPKHKIRFVNSRHWVSGIKY